jgi:hypothetical protein
MCNELWTVRSYAVSTELLFELGAAPWWLFPCVVGSTAVIVSRTKSDNAFLRVLLAVTIILMTLLCLVLTYALLDGIPEALRLTVEQLRIK